MSSSSASVCREKLQLLPCLSASPHELPTTRTQEQRTEQTRKKRQNSGSDPLSRSALSSSPLDVQPLQTPSRQCSRRFRYRTLSSQRTAAKYSTMRLPSVNPARTKNILHGIQGLIIFLAWALTIAVFTKGGGIDGRSAWYWALVCCLSLSCGLRLVARILADSFIGLEILTRRS